MTKYAIEKIDMTNYSRERKEFELNSIQEITIKEFCKETDEHFDEILGRLNDRNLLNKFLLSSDIKTLNKLLKKYKL